MRKLILILVSLILVGCGGSQSSYKTYKHYIYVENIFGRELFPITAHNQYGQNTVHYRDQTDNTAEVESKTAALLQKCKNEWKNANAFGITNLDEGCSTSKEQDEKIYNSKKYKDLLASIENDKKKKEEAIVKAKRDQELKIKTEKIAKIELLYSSKCKKFKQGSPEYENCLFESEKLAIQEQNKLANLPPTERYAYTCEKTYGFKKGSDNFKECVFKIMTTEYQMQAKLNETRIKELEARIAGMERSASANASYNNQMLEIERMKAKAMQDQVNFAKNKDITDTLLGMSGSLLSPNRPSAPSSNNFMLNCQTRKFGGFDQIQCF